MALRQFYFFDTVMLTPITLFKCLADETRLRCLMLLHKQGKLCVCELTDALDMLQPKISRHLALLRQSSILLDSRQGQWVYYQINPALPNWAMVILDATAQQYVDHPHHQNDQQRLLEIKNPAFPISCCD
jgi:ArsR family transcriptional regulator